MGRRVLIGLIVVVAILGVVFMLGPRVPVDTTVSFDPASIGPDPDIYLIAAERTVPGIRPGHQKEIVWADPAARVKTPFAIVYIHGFSASKGEIRPVPDLVAKDLGANLYFARLAGHGRDGSAMATASVKDWIDDVAEAMAVGRLIGERVIVMATSTGGALATVAASHPDLRDGIAGLVLVSPNYRLKAAGSGLLTLPWGATIARLAIGPERGFEPANALHATWWTLRYPTSALLPLAAVTTLARETAVESVMVPALFLYSPADKVVDPEATRSVAARWGGPHETIIVEDTADPSGHVLAGEALSPGTTKRVAADIARWVRSLP